MQQWPLPMANIGLISLFDGIIAVKPIDKDQIPYTYFIVFQTLYKVF